MAHTNPGKNYIRVAFHIRFGYFGHTQRRFWRFFTYWRNVVMADKSRVLVVDDEDALRMVLSSELSSSGYDVATASDGDEAVAAVQNKKFDLILLDIKMPKVDG